MSQSIDLGEFGATASTQAASPMVPLNRSLRFEGMVFDPQNLELSRDGQRVMLQPLPGRLLLHLLRNRSRIVSKEELHAVLWPNTFVSDAAISSTLRDLRRAVRDEGQHQDIIRTYRGRGYRFVADVEFDDGYVDSSYQHPSPLELRAAGASTRFEVPFVGRIAELEELDRRLTRAVADRAGSLVLVEGMVGTGKSGLLDQFGRQTGDTLLVRHVCNRDLWKPPLLTVAEVLTRLMAELDGAGRPDGPRPTEFEVARRFARGDSGHLELGAKPRDAALRLLAFASKARPVIVLVDDLHFADEESMDLFLSLAKGLADLPVLLVASLEEALLSPRMSAAVRGLPAGDRLPLKGLNLSAVERLAEAVMSRGPDTAWLRSLHHNTDGCPGPTLELLRCAARLEPDPPQVPELPLPEALVDILRGRFQLVSPEARQLVVAASVIPAEAEASGLAAVAGLSHLDEDHLGTALAAGWLLPGSRPNRMRMGSPFLRRVVLSGLSKERRRQIAFRASRLGTESHPENVVSLEKRSLLEKGGEGSVAAARDEEEPN